MAVDVEIILATKHRKRGSCPESLIIYFIWIWPRSTIPDLGHFAESIEER